MAGAVTNTTSTETIASMFPVEFYTRQLLEWMKGNLVYAQHGQKKSMPAHNGKVAQFRRYTPYGANTTPLSEGVVPDGLALTQTDVNATVAQYGDFIRITDWVDLTALDPVMSDSVDLLAEAAKETIDALCIAELKNASNVIFAASSGTPASAASDITPAYKLTTLEIRKAVRQLKKNKAKPFMRNGKPYYYCYVCPDTVFDLQADSKWEAVATYQQAEKIETGEIGKLYGVVFLDATNPVVWAGAGDTKTAAGEGGDPPAVKYDVYGTPVFGQNAYGTVSIDGTDGNAEIIIKGFEDGGTSQPLNQIATIGYKIQAFCCKILDQSGLVMIKHGVSDN